MTRRTLLRGLWYSSIALAILFSARVIPLAAGQTTKTNPNRHLTYAQWMEELKSSGEMDRSTFARLMAETKTTAPVDQAKFAQLMSQVKDTGEMDQATFARLMADTKTAAPSDQATFGALMDSLQNSASVELERTKQ